MGAHFSNWGQIPIVSEATRHGGSFFWSFAQKMAPRPGGFEVMFRCKLERQQKKSFTQFRHPINPLQLVEHGGSDA
jgi:hypothetical protein